MIIKKIQIENYLCYFDTKTFELSDGLNIILGENGEGKTKFFEAVDWLFKRNDDDDDRELDHLVSAKKLEETEIGAEFQVRVSMTVEQFGEKKIITRSFIAKKESENSCSTPTRSVLEGIEENSSGERTQVDGKNLLDRIFPFQIRKYSMFKGEADLDIFKSENALVNLINLFSDAKHYEKYSEKGAFLREKAEKAVEKSAKSDKKNEARYKKLESEIHQLFREKEKYTVLRNSTDEEIRKIEGNLQKAERHSNNAEALGVLNKRIKGLEDKISSLISKIDENYTTSLFDNNWILVNYESLHKEFASKVSAHSKKQRKIQSEFDKQKGIEEGKKKAKAELLNDALSLPDGVPTKSHMEEMLKEEICKVCNREARKGSEAYEFMMKRLTLYLESQVVEDDKTEKDEPLFQYNYTNRLENLSTSHEDNLKNLRLIHTQIKDRFEFNDARKKEVEELKELLEKEKTDREEILGDSSLAAEKLNDVLKNSNTWQRDLKDRNQDENIYNTRLQDIESELKSKKEEKNKIDTISAHSSLIKTQKILRDIETIFNDTKDKKFEKFIEKLQNKSNAFFKTINIRAFTGTIVFNKQSRGNKTIVKVELQEDRRTFDKPNQSLLTSMHISILFAISELALEVKEENFPMIFDAPTSSFGENKTAQFLNLIFETKSQKILLIKDFLESGKDKNSLSLKGEFKKVKRDKAFWVKLERPFDSNSLKTINSQIIEL